MKALNYIILALAIGSFFSCTKIIDVEVNDSEPRLVIEANYDATNERVKVSLSITKNVFEGGVNPVVTGATVEVSDVNGITTPLIDQGDGTYLLENYVPIFESNYSLSVIVDGEVYQSTTFLPSIVELDSLSQVFTEASLFGEAGYVVFMNFLDPAGLPNFYRALRNVNGEPLVQLGEQFIFDDTFSEGNTQTVPFFSTRHEVGDSVSVEFRSYSEASYNYYSQLFAIAGDGGQSAAPANPISNWSNNALGHFAAWGSDTKYVIVEE
jgi:hypothetical protein